MKQIKFETSQGEFKIVDEKDYMVFHLMLTENGLNAISLKGITEEQASELLEVYARNNFGTLENPDYGYYDYTKDNFHLNSYVESLHSLLKSKGIHLFENTAPLLSNHRLEAESKTFYNPYIFKIK